MEVCKPERRGGDVNEVGRCVVREVVVRAVEVD